MEMNVQITQNGDDITGKLISYERNIGICTGIGTLNVTLERLTGLEFDPWDTIILWENNIRKGTFYVSEVTKSAHLGTIDISCIDGAKKLLEYYITDVYEIDYVSYAKYWLEKFLTEAGVTYSINAEGNGSVMSNNTSIGPEQAYDVVLRLLQMCGWYMYFDGDGTCQIGALVIDTDSYDHTFYGDEVINVETSKNDKMLRNRAVVWGNSDPDTSTWVFADRSTTTPYNYDEEDKRAAVLANSNIDSVSSATILANKMLDEFAKITHEKTITLVGVHNVLLGEVAYINYNLYNTVGMITSIASNMSASGLTTTIILDQRCPRLFGYYGYLGYVYIGTYGSGVWRKLIEGSTWSDFSTGLSNLYIIDLYIREGVFACVTGDGNAYYRTVNSTSWALIAKPEVTYTDIDDVEQNVSNYNLKIIGCTVNDEHNLQFIANHRDDEIKKSWVMEYSPEGTFIRYSLIETTGSDEHTCIDIDGNSSSNIITTKITSNEILIPIIGDDDGDYGERETHQHERYMIPTLPPITRIEQPVADVGGSISTSFSTETNTFENVFIQNTDEDKGIVYYFYIYNSICYIKKYVFTEGYDEWGEYYAVWTTSTDVGGFTKTFPSSKFESYTLPYGAGIAFEVIDDNTFSFLATETTTTINLNYYKYYSESDVMQKTVLFSVPTTYSFTGTRVNARSKITILMKYKVYDGGGLGLRNGYQPVGYMVDMITGTIVSNLNLPLTGNYLGEPDVDIAADIGPGFLFGSTVYYIHYKYVTYQIMQESVGHPCGIATGAAATIHIRVIKFNLESNSIYVTDVTDIDEGLIATYPKVDSQEKDYLGGAPSGTRSYSSGIVYQDIAIESALYNLGVSFSIKRYTPDPYCVYEHLYTETIINNYLLSLPECAIVGTIGTSTLKTVAGETDGGDPFVYPENYQEINLLEIHTTPSSRITKTILPINGTAIIVDSGSNYSGPGTGYTPVFRNGLTLQITSGIEKPTGLGEYLETVGKTEYTWWDGGTYTLNTILIMNAIGVQDAVDGTNYVVIGDCTNVSNGTFNSYLIGYDSGGNIVKRFYYPRDVYEYVPELDDWVWLTYHDEPTIMTNTQMSDFSTIDLHGNILYYKAKRFDYGAGDNIAGFIRFYQYTLPSTEVQEDIYYALRQNYSSYSNFTVITDHTYPLKVDISKETPTAVYSRTVGSGIASVLRTSYTNAVDDFNVVTNERRIIIHEARPFSVIDEGNFYVYSGALEETGVDYILAASTNDVRFIEASLAGEWNTLASFDELVSHIETTNYTMNAYFFVSLSGEADTHSFYQRNKDGVSFINYSAGLPSGSGITIIRVDDVI